LVIVSINNYLPAVFFARKAIREKARTSDTSATVDMTTSTQDDALFSNVHADWTFNSVETAFDEAATNIL
jgi:hypothetical protein